MEKLPRSSLEKKSCCTFTIVETSWRCPEKKNYVVASNIFFLCSAAVLPSAATLLHLDAKQCSIVAKASGVAAQSTFCLLNFCNFSSVFLSSLQQQL